MNKVENGLQRLTETEEKIQELLKKNQLSKDDTSYWTLDEKNKLGQHITRLLNTYKGVEHDDLLWKIDAILPKDTKNQIWENNHFLITTSISKLIEEYGKMPTKNQIASDTGLSRYTVHKHLKGYAEHPLYEEQLKMFKFMSDRVMGKVIKMAVHGEGNVRAARLYFEMMGYMNNEQNSKKTMIQNQNNFIQINGTVLSQDAVKQLNPEQLNTIETILKTALEKQNLID